MTQRHKVFVSYHHANDESYRDKFDKTCTEVLIPKSVQIGDIDPNLMTETIRQKIRDEYLRDSTVTVVLIGSETWKRKHIDWEIASSLRQTEFNRRSGIIGIILPTHPDYGKVNYNPHTIPPRLHDNVSNGFVTIHHWSNDEHKIQSWIHDAFNRRNTIIPNNSRDSFKNNRPSYQSEWQ
jgi:hypothetical protein